MPTMVILKHKEILGRTDLMLFSEKTRTTEKRYEDGYT
jgi:hypothetical protein